MILILEPIIKVLMAPIDFVRSTVFGVKSAKGKVQFEVSRVKAAGDDYKNAVGGARNAVGQAGVGGNGTGKKKKKRKKMGLFSKKKPCPSCGESLHASWDKCPYCNWSEKGGAAPRAAAPAAAPMAAPAMSANAPKQRTVAISVGGGAAVPTGPNIGWLIPLEGEQLGELFTLTQPRCVVGTKPDCNVILRDTSISGRHAEFTISGAVFKVTDLGSTNGTFVNDKKVTNSELVDNDNVKLGLVNFKFKSLN